MMSMFVCEECGICEAKRPIDPEESKVTYINPTTPHLQIHKIYNKNLNFGQGVRLIFARFVSTASVRLRSLF